MEALGSVHWVGTTRKETTKPESTDSYRWTA